MDKTTKWLIRLAAVSIIGLGIGIPTYLIISDRNSTFLSANKEKEEKLTNLQNAMKQVAARLDAGTSLRDSTISFQPVIDALALAEDSHPETYEVKNARKAAALFDVLQMAWDTRIKAYNREWSEYSEHKTYNCEALKLSADSFNRVYGSTIIPWEYKKGLFGIKACQVPYGSLPEDFMRPIIRNLLLQKY
jgi:hypothetical protein